MATTITETKTFALNSVEKVSAHSEISLLIKMKDGSEYFAGMIEQDHKNGTVTLTPVLTTSIYSNEDEEDELLP